MKLIIKYQDGMQRIVGLHPSFFENPEFSVAQRARDLAFAYGSRPYDIQVLRGMNEDYHSVIPANLPDKQPAYGIDEKGIKAKLRKEFKRKPFSYTLNTFDKITA